jgi:pimeloyl-ACP methyl ester carboxylesterase
MPTESPSPTLAFDRLAADGPRVVLLHAGVADRRAWRDVAPALHARGADVLAYDRRGFGETPPSAEPFRHVDDLLGLLEAPAWLVGNSMGGAISLDAALLAPEMVAGLVLIAPAVSGEPQLSEEELDADTRRLAQAIDEADEAGDLEVVNRHEVHLWLDGPAGSEGRVGGAARELAWDMNAIALGAGAPEDAGESGEDAWSRLEEIRAPATIVWGTLDLPAIIERCQELAQRLGDVRATIELPGLAHLPALERPDLVTEIIADAVGL